MANVPCQSTGSEPNPFFNLKFLQNFRQIFMPIIALWTSLLLGNLGRHGRDHIYQEFNKRYIEDSNKLTANYTRNNSTQGIMEKSQSNLKSWRHGKIYVRLDDFLMDYKDIHKGMVRRFTDTSGIRPLKTKAARFDMEMWKGRVPQSRRNISMGYYVTWKNHVKEFQKVEEKVLKRSIEVQQHKALGMDTSKVENAQNKEKVSSFAHIISSEWFTSSDINRAQILMKIKYPSVAGLYDVDFISKLGLNPLPADFHAEPPTSDFVQILNVN